MNYHITQERATELFEPIAKPIKTVVALRETIHFVTDEQLQAYANAVLDKVLGEPVGEIIGDRWKSMQFLASMKRSDVNKLPPGTKLYAPKELP